MTYNSFIINKIDILQKIIKLKLALIAIVYMGRFFTLFFILFFTLQNYAEAQYLINESFESPTSAPWAPSGWTYNSLTNGSNNPRTGSRCLTFNAAGDYAISPLLTTPDQLSFYYRRSTNTNAWGLRVEVLNSSDDPIDTLALITSVTTTYVEYTADLSAYSNIKIKITDTRATGTPERYIDDFTVTNRIDDHINISRPSADEFSYNFGSGPSATDTFMISGQDLSPANGHLGIKASSNFEISESPSGPFSDSIALSYSGSILSETIIYVRMIAGLNLGNYSGTVTASGGASSSKMISLSGVVTKGPCYDLLISEYIEGGGNNKYLEIYNPTANTIQLKTGSSTNHYRLILYRNGGSTIQANGTFTFPNNSSIEPYSTIVVSHPSASIYSGTITALTVGGGGGTLDFNGNDAIALQKYNGSAWEDIDIFGRIGHDPGGAWIVPGISTVNRTLSRRPEVTLGIDINPASGFPTLSTEWINYPQDEFHTLGHHVSTCYHTHYTMIDTLHFHRYCNEDSISVRFTGYGNYSSGTIFTAEISDATGSFAAPTSLGTLTLSASGTDIRGIITGELPNDYASRHYHIRVNSSVANTGMVISQPLSSTAIQLPPSVHFRSKQSGDWRDITSWSLSTDSSYWEDDCAFPWYTYTLSTKILSGDTITVSDVSGITDVIISNLEILEGATLLLEPNSEFHIVNADGVDFTVNGTLYDQTNSGTGNGLRFPDGDATWQLGINGTVIKTSSSAVVGNYRDQYEGGIVNIPASANWIFRKETSTNPTLTTLGMFFPNLYLEDTYIGDVNYSFTGNSGFATVKGSLYIGTSGNSVLVTNNNYNATPMTVMGSVEIGNSSTFRIENITNPGTGLLVGGNITNNGLLDLNHSNTGVLRLNGSSNQTISGIGTFDIWNLQMNKSPQTLAILDTNIEVKNQLNFNGGIIYIPESSDTLFISNGDPLNAITGHDVPNNTGIYSDDNYVIGNLRRRINAPSSVYVFPVGDITLGYNPSRLTIRNIPITTPPTPPPYAVGRFVNSWPGTINTFRFITCGSSTNFIEYRGLTNEGYWEFGGTEFVNYDINIHPNSANQNILPNEDTELGHNSNYRALKESNAQAGAVWNPDVSVLGNPCIVSNSYYDIIGSGYTGFSIFAPGGGIGNTTALPIDLLYFNINCQPFPAIHWATASELNTDYFTIEQSSDGHNFSPITHIEAAGNSNHKIEYSYIPDNETGPYYRLTETDLDGSIYYHGIIHNDCIDKNIGKTKVFYQYGNGIIAQFAHRRIPTAVQIYDAAGRFISAENIAGDQNSLKISEANKWAKGMYFVSLFYSDNDIVTEKVVVY